MTRPFVRQLACAFAMVVAATAARAEWTLEPMASHLSFASVKEGDIGEVNHFTSLEGAISEDGAATVTVDLASVETWIDIRNERMREFLFKVDRFPTATITAKLDLDALADLPVGATTALDLPVTLTLNGEESGVDTSVTVARLGEDKVMVVSREIVMIDASLYGYEDGIRKLMELAGLSSISAAVPVSFVLVFTQEGGL